MRLLHPEVREVTPEDLFDLYDAPGPLLRADFVLSVDGTVAVEGRAAPLASPADKAVFRAMRTVADAVVVGAGTARIEDYGPVNHRGTAVEWRAAHGFPEHTPLVVVSRSGRIPADARFLAGPTIVAVPEGTSVPDSPAEVLRTSSPQELVAALHERGLTRLLCEGGPTLLTSFMAADVVDELCLTTAPLAVGNGPFLLGPVPTTDLRLLSLVHDDPGVLLARWSVVRSSGD
jgi:riboflavin biosynthesis pyrimidine reductase